MLSILRGLEQYLSLSEMLLWRLVMSPKSNSINGSSIYIYATWNRPYVVELRRRRWHPTPVLLPNPMGRGAWWAAVHGVAKSWTWLSDFPFTFHFHALEKKMATHSSVLAWRIPRTGEPGGLPSLGSHRVRHDWSDLAAAAYNSQLWLAFPWN